MRMIERGNCDFTLFPSLVCAPYAVQARDTQGEDCAKRLKIKYRVKR